MMRGTFANIRLRNLLLPGTEGGVTLHIPSGEQMSIFEASVKYKATNTALVISRARNTARAARAIGRPRHHAARRQGGDRESFERIHRSNLIAWGVLPLQYKDGQSAHSLG